MAMNWFVTLIHSFVVEYYVEIGSLLLLTLITIFRRELSINDEYRLSKHDDSDSGSIGHSADPTSYQSNGAPIEDSDMSLAHEGEDVSGEEEEVDESLFDLIAAMNNNSSIENNSDNNDTNTDTLTSNNNDNTSDGKHITDNKEEEEDEESLNGDAINDTLFKIPTISSINIHSINQLVPNSLSNISSNFSALAMKMPFLNRGITSIFDLRSLFRLARRRDRMRREIRVDKDDLADDLRSVNNNTNNKVVENEEQGGESPFYKLRVENLLHVVEFLLHADISALSGTSYQMYKDCRGDFIWRNLWIQNFAEMWNCDKIEEIRRRRGITWNPLSARSKDSSAKLSGKTEKSEKKKKKSEGRERPSLMRQYSSGSIDSTAYHDSNEEDMTPVQGWYMFYLEFEACWIDWLLAGECTEESCFVGICGSIYDLTSFLPYHPGSVETLSESCGGDGTDSFIDVGHSQNAVVMSRDFLVWSPYQLTFAKNKSSEQQSNVRKMLGHYQMNSYRQKIITKFHAIMRREKHVVEKHMAKENVRHSIVSRDLRYAQQEKALALLSGNHIVGSGNSFSEHFFSDSNDKDDDIASDNGNGNNHEEEEEKEEIIYKEGECVCSDGSAHKGRVRGMYDPLAQKWRCWWTCCSHFTDLPLELSMGMLDATEGHSVKALK